jgi:hypothetical protein
VVEARERIVEAALEELAGELQEVETRAARLRARLYGVRYSAATRACGTWRDKAAHARPAFFLSLAELGRTKPFAIGRPFTRLERRNGEATRVPTPPFHLGP